MRRVLANILAGVCLVLFVLSGFMWIRGYAVADHLRHQSTGGFSGVLSSTGDLAVYDYDWPARNAAVESAWSLQTGQPMNIPQIEREKAAHSRSFIGFHFFRDSEIAGGGAAVTLRGWCLVLPYWFLTLVFAFVPLGRFLTMAARAPKRRRTITADGGGGAA